MQNPYVTLRHYGLCLRLTPLWVQSKGSRFLAIGRFERACIGLRHSRNSEINGETNMFASQNIQGGFSHL